MLFKIAEKISSFPYAAKQAAGGEEQQPAFNWFGQPQPQETPPSQPPPPSESGFSWFGAGAPAAPVQPEPQTPEASALLEELDAIDVESQMLPAEETEQLQDVQALYYLIDRLDIVLEMLDATARPNREIRAMRTRANELKIALQERLTGVVERNIRIQPPNISLTNYIRMARSIMEDFPITGEQRTRLMRTLEGRYQFLADAYVQQLSQSGTAEVIGPRDTTTVYLRNPKVTPPTNEERIGVITRAWFTLFADGAVRSMAARQMRLLIDDGASQEEIQAMQALIDEAAEIDAQAIMEAQAAYEALPGFVIDETNIFPPREEDMIIGALGLVGFSTAPIVSPNDMPFDRRTFMEEIRNAAAEAYAEYLRGIQEQVSDTDSDYSEIMGGVGNSMVTGAPDFEAEFEFFIEDGIIEHVEVNVNGASISVEGEGARLPILDIGRKIAEGIGVRILPPCYIHYFRIKLAFDVQSSMVTATILDY